MQGKKNSFLLRLMTTISTGVLLSTGMAFGQNSISVGSAEGEAGSDVAVQILVNSDKDIAGAQFSLIFDQTRLQIKETANGADAPAMTPVGVDVTVANSNGTLQASLVDFSFANPVAAGENREIYVVTFTIAAGTAAGDIALTLEDVSLSDPSGSDISIEVLGGTVTVTQEGPPPVVTGEANLTVTDAEGATGYDVTVQVLASSDKDISGAQFSLLFDQTRLQIKETANGTDASAMSPVGVDIEAANSNGTLQVSLVDFSFVNPVAAGENRVIYVVTFTIAAGTVAGDIPLTLEEVSLSDPSGSDISAEVAGGTVTVTGEGPPPVVTGEATLTVTDAEGTSSSDVTVQVLASSENDIAGASFSLIFDQTSLQIKEVAVGTDASAMSPVGVDVAAANSNGTLQVSLVDFSFANPIAAGENREIYVVTFTIAAGTAAGDIALTLEEVSLSDPSGSDISSEVAGGTVTVTGEGPPPVITGEATLTVTDAQGAAGSDVTVQVLASSEKDIAGASFSLVFDQTSLQIKEVARGADASAMSPVGVDAAAANSDGSLEVSLVDFSFANPIAAGENREIYIVTFTIASGTAAGDIALTLEAVSLSDPSGSDISANMEGGTISVAGAGPGPGPGPVQPPMENNFLWSRAIAGTAGQTLSTTFDLNNLVTIAGVSFNVSFDNSLIQLTEVKTYGDAAIMSLVGFQLSDANSSGEFGVSMVDFSFANPIATGLGSILQLSFTFQGTGKVEFTINDLSLSDTQGNDVPAEVFYSDVPVVTENNPPRWGVQSVTLELTEGESFSHTFAPPVDDDPDDIVVVVARNLPEGGEFNIEDLTFSWTPGLEDAGVYQFYVVAIDQEEAKGHQRVTLVVENTNQPPRLILDEEAIEAKEGEILSFTVGTIDDDGDQVGVEAQNLPEGAEFFDPVFLWQEPVEGEYTITFVATDNPYNLTDTREVTITVIGVNDPPVFDLVPDVSVETGEPVEIVLSATDPDDDVLTLTYSLIVTGEDNILSRGATFVGNTFNWIPAATDIGPNIVTFMVEDLGGLKDFLEVTITVIGRNIQLPPEFDVAFYQTCQMIEEEGELVVELAQTLTNPEQEGLEFWVDNLPEGAEFDEVTATITWTPNLLQAGTYEVLCGVSDGNFPDIKILYIEVTDKDVTPILEVIGDRTVYENDLLKINLQANDASGEHISFKADTLTLPEGAKVFGRGLVKWRPGFDQAGTYQVTLYAFDASGNYVSETVTITVLDVNRKPELVADNQFVVEGGTLQFSVAATDLDGDEVTYAAFDLPDGAAFDEETGLFDWTPSQEQSGNYVVLFTADDGKGGVDSVQVVITVGDVNLPPEIDPVGDQVVAEGSSLSFEITASDPDEGDQLTIELSGMPEGATLTYDPGNPVTAAVELTPGYLDAGIYEVLVTASDDNPENSLSVSRSFQLEVTDTDVAPVLTGQLAGTGVLELSVDEGGLLEIEVTAEDPGGDALNYSTSGLPKNAWSDFTGARKLVSFAPDHTQSGTCQFEIIISDGAQIVSKTVKVTVNEVNLPPVVYQIEDQSVEEGDFITFAVNYRDPDGDEATVYTGGRVSFLTEGDPAPASIRDNKVFIFDTALLPPDEQIASAVFLFWAIDVRDGVSDTVRVEIAVVRRDSIDVSNLASGQQAPLDFTGLGIGGRIINNRKTVHMRMRMRMRMRSGFMELAGLPSLASAEGGKLKAEKGVYTYLAGDDLTSQFYGIRRGWGLDLSAQEQVEGADVEVVLSYFDEDLPTEVPNFTEERLSVFGYDPNLGEWVEIEGVTVDTEANQATFTIADYSIVDYTIGAEVDVVAPVITDLKVVAGSYTVVATGVDTTYDLDGPYEFRVNITDDEIISSTEAKFYYSLDGVSFEEVELERLSGNLFTAEVSGPMSSGSTILYYVTARDEMNVVSSPSGAPDEVYELVVVEYTAVPGDVDQSGSINIFDLLDLLQVLSGSKPSSLGSDVNQDSSTNIFDLLALLAILAG